MPTPALLASRAATSLTAAQSYEDLILASSPDLYWRLGEAAGTTAEDTSTNNRDGGYAGTYALAQPALIDDADTSVGFTNGGVRLTGYSMLNPSGQRTIEMWASKADSAASYTLVGSATADDVLFANVTDGDVKLRVGGTSCTWAGAWPGNNVPVHVVCTFNDTTNTAELYIDGVSEGTQSNAGTIGGDRFWAADSNGFATNWKGVIDEVASYTGTLSAATILEHYEVGAGV